MRGNFAMTASTMRLRRQKTRGICNWDDNITHMDNDYTPHDAGNNTHQVGDKFYKTPEELAMKHEEVLLDLLTERKDEDQIYY